MKKILIGGTVCLLAALLLVGWLDVTSPLLWVAASSMWFAVVRSVMLGMLVLLFFTNPPRALWLRLISMGLGLGMSVAAIVMTVTYQINFLDAVIMLEVGIICMIEALEAELYEEYSVIDMMKAVGKRQFHALTERISAVTALKRTHTPTAHIGSLTTK